jgi:hypothetical protein
MRDVRYPDSAGPVVTDWRDIDVAVAELSGEASHQVSAPGEAAPVESGQVWRRLPVPAADDPTYYDCAVLKEPVWKAYIPMYYFAGGLAGAALALGAAAQLARSREFDRMIRRCHWIGIVGSSVGGMLLIADLGKPARFLYMLRVFRPTSPMNMGVWLLAGAPAAAITAGLFARSGPGALGALGEAAGYAAGLFGLGLSTYTGVLVGNSAIPVWQESRTILPVLFGASGVAAAGSVFDLLFEDPRACRATRMYGILGRTVELAAAYAMEKRAGEVPRVGRPLRRGVSGLLWRTATALTAASLITLLWPGQNRKKRVAAGVLGALGSLTMRFAVNETGRQSSRDPRATFHQQRAGRGAREVTAGEATV